MQTQKTYVHKYVPKMRGLATPYTRKLINVIILGPRKIKEKQDQRSTTVALLANTEEGT